MRNTACVVCGKELKAAIEYADPEEKWQHHAPPSGATVFISHGNYGSTLWDPGPSSRDYLQATICDKCLSQAAASGRVLHCHPYDVQRPVAYSAWDGHKEAD